MVLSQKFMLYIFIENLQTGMALYLKAENLIFNELICFLKQTPFLRKLMKASKGNN